MKLVQYLGIMVHTIAAVLQLVVRVMSRKSVSICLKCNHKLTCLNCRGENRKLQRQAYYGTGALKHYSSASKVPQLSPPGVLQGSILSREDAMICQKCQSELRCLLCLKGDGFMVHKATHESKQCSSVLQLQQMSEMSSGASSEPLPYASQQLPTTQLKETSFGAQSLAAVGRLPAQKLPPKPHPRMTHKQVIKILISGKSGTSKSVVINGLVGRQLIPERKGVVCKPRSDKLEYYSCHLERNEVRVWSSPHLQDEDRRINIDEYCEEMKRSCSNVDLIIYCLNMTETRFLPGNPDIKAMIRLTNLFGESCWRKTVFVMTFANLAAASTFSAEEGDSDEMNVIAFKNGLFAWQKVIRDALINEAQVQQEVNIKVVPAGHYSRPSLPDRESWLADLFLECISTMPEDAQEAMIKGNLSRLQRSQSFYPGVVRGKKIYEQQITVLDTFIKKCPSSLADFILKAIS